MNAAPTILSWALAGAPVPSNAEAPVIEADEYTTAAGHRTRWASGSYLLPNGQFAEIFITADDTASGEAIISVDGEAIVSSSYTAATGVTSWTSSEPGAGELAAAAMTAIADRGGSELLDAFVPDKPQEFPCSDFGKKAVKVARYLWVAASYATGAACCVGATAATAVGCVACASAVGVVGLAGTEALDGYCD